MIYGIWYPSGGFGHYVNAIISVYGENFARPPGDIEFSQTGDSHNLPRTVSKYCGATDYDSYDIFRNGKGPRDPNKNYSVLIDPGIEDDGRAFLKHFPKISLIKISYDDYEWPIVAYAAAEKAMRTGLDAYFDPAQWPEDNDRYRREAYYLFLKESPLRKLWNPNEYSLSIREIFYYDMLRAKLEKYGIKLDQFRDVHGRFKEANFKYFKPTMTTDVTHLTTPWDQAVLYYIKWLETGIDMPFDDFPRGIYTRIELQEIYDQN